MSDTRTLSDVVTELLGLLGVADNVKPMPTLPDAPTLSKTKDGSTEEKQRIFVENAEKLRVSVETNYKSDPSEGKSPNIKSAHEKALKQFNDAVLEGPEAGDLAKVQERYDKLVALHRFAREANPARLNLKLALDSVLSKTPGSVGPGTTELEAKSLFETRDTLMAEITNPRATVGTDFRPLAEKIAQLKTDVQALQALGARREALRAELQKEASAATLVADAPAADGQKLVGSRDAIGLAITNAKTLPELEIQATQITALENEIQALGATVDKRKAKRVQMAESADKLMAGLDQVPYLVMEPVTAARADLDEHLTGELTQDAEDKAAKALLALRGAVTEARGDAANLGSMRTILRGKIGALKQKAAGKDYKALPGMEHIVETLGKLEAELRDQNEAEDLAAICESGSTLRETLDGIAGRMDEAVKKALDNWRKDGDQKLTDLEKLIYKRLQELEEKAAELDKSFKSTSMADLAEKCRKDVETQLKIVDKPHLQTAQKLVEKLAEQIGKQASRFDGIVERVGLRRTAILQRLAPLDPDPLPPGIPPLLQAGRDAVTAKLDVDLMSLKTELLKEGETLAVAFETDFAAAQTIATAWKAVLTRFKTVRDRARTALQPELDRQFGLAEKATTLATALVLAEGLVRLLDEAEAETAEAEKSKNTLGEVQLDGSKLDEKLVGEIYDVVGPAGVKALDSEQLATLCSCFKGASEAEGKALKSLVSESFAGRGDVLANLARTGDREAILELATAYADPGAVGDRANMQSLVTKGGLGGGAGGSPTVVGDLLGFGLGASKDKTAQRSANVAKIREIGVAFSGEDGAASMRTLASDCAFGLARKTKPARHGALTDVLQAGFGGDAAKLRTFADGFGGDTEQAKEDRANMKNLIGEGGFGEQPRALGPLVGRLSKAGPGDGATKLKAIGGVFTVKADREKLAKVLENGGVSGDTHFPDGSEDPARKHEHADTLAKVYTDGLGERPENLRTFAQSFGDTPRHQTQCKDMMDSFNEYPDKFKDSRQPGKKIKKVLPRFGGNVRQLQQTFTQEMEGFGSGTDQQRKATRIAPYFEEADNGDHPPVPGGTDVTQIITNYICNRHLPKFAKRSQLAAFNSYLPPLKPKKPSQDLAEKDMDNTDGETDAHELYAMLEEGFTDPNMPKAGDPSTDVDVASWDVKLGLGVTPTGALPHCQPGNKVAGPHPREVPTFSRDEARRVFRSVGLAA